MADNIKDVRSALQGMAREAQSFEKTLQGISVPKNLEKTKANLTKATGAFRGFTDAVKAGNVELASLMRKYGKVVDSMNEKNEKLLKSKGDLAKKQKELSDLMSGENAGTKEQAKRIKEVDKEVSKYQKSIERLNGQLKDHSKELQQPLRALKDIKEQYSITSKAQNLLSSGVVKFGAAIVGTFTVAAAHKRWIESTNLAIDLSIQKFNGMKDVQGGLVKTALAHANALRTVAMTAIDANVPIEEAQGFYKDINRLMGTSGQNAVVLAQRMSKLTEYATLYSKVMNVSMADAMAITDARMLKMGGTAEDAAEFMFKLSEDIDSVNISAGKTVIRADDLTRELADLSRNTQLYSLDQRHVSEILKSSVANIQAQGDSYQFAMKAAKNYGEALTTGAPEWMKILTGQDLVGTLNKNMKGGKLELDEFMIQELEKGKPGISKKIKEVMEDQKMNAFDKSVLIQDMLEGTSVGMDAMNKRILKLGELGPYMIAKTFGKSITEANAMYALAKSEDALVKKTREEANKQTEAKMKEFNLVDMYMQKEHLSREEATKKAREEAKQYVDIVKIKESIRKADDSAAVTKLNDKETELGKAKKELSEASSPYEKAKAQRKLDVLVDEKKQQEAYLAERKKATTEELAGNKDLATKLTNFASKVKEYFKHPFIALAMSVLSVAGIGAFKAVKMYMEYKNHKEVVSKLEAIRSALLSGDKSGPEGGGFLSGLGNKAKGAGKFLGKHKGKIGIGLGIAALAGGAYGLSKMFGGKKEGEPPAEGEQPTGEEQPKEPSLPSVLMDSLGVGGLAGMAGGALKGVGKFGKFAKLGKAIPGLGTLIGGAGALGNMWDIGKGALSGQGVKGGDLASLGMNAASMIPGIGTIASIADMGMSATGVYDNMGTIGGSDVVSPPTAIAATTTTEAAAPKINGPIASRGAKLTSSGALAFEIPNFLDIFSQAGYKVMQSTV